MAESDILSGEVFLQAVAEHAAFLGMDVEADRDYLWIAEEALLAELPPEWEHHADKNKNPYYYNSRTGESSWENPLDQPYRELFQRLKREGAKVNSVEAVTARRQLIGKFNAAAPAGDKAQDRASFPPKPPPAASSPSHARRQKSKQKSKAKKRSSKDLAIELGLDDQGEYTESSDDEGRPDDDDPIVAAIESAEARIRDLEKKADDAVKRAADLERQLAASRATEQNQDKTLNASLAAEGARWQRIVAETRARAEAAEKLNIELEEKVKTISSAKSKSAGQSVAARLSLGRKIDELTEELDRAKAEAAAAASEKDRVYGALKEAREAIVAAGEEASKLKGDLISAREREAAEQRKSARAAGEVEILETASARLKKELSEVAQENLKLRQGLEEAEQNVAAARREMKATTAETSSESSKETVKLRQELQDALVRIDGLNEELQTARASSVSSPFARAREERDSMFEKLNETSKELIGAKEKIQASERVVQRLRGETDTLRCALDSVKRELDDEIAASHALKGQRRELEDRIRTLERDLQRSGSSAEHLVDAARRALESDLDAEREKRAAAERENTALRQELSNASSARSQREADEVALRLEAAKRADGVAVELESARATIERDAERIRDLDMTLSAVREEARRRDDEMAQKCRELIEVRELYEGGKRRAERATSEYNLLQSSLEALKSELETERSLNDALRKRDAVHEKELGAADRRTAEKVREADERASSAEADAADAREEVARLRQKLTKSASMSSAEAARLREEVQRLRIEAEERNGREKLESEASSSEVDGLRSELRILKQTSAARVESLEKELMDVIVSLREETKKRRELHNRLVDLQGNIRVYCRVRPILDHEKRRGDKAAMMAVAFPEEETIALRQEMLSRDQEDRFEFDKVFQPHSTQTSVYAEVEPLAASVMDGYRVCIFAYGQTGSGKTYTMDGSEGEPGVNARALRSLFLVAEEKRASVKYKLRMSMLEIYNETIQDLLVSRAKLRALMEAGQQQKLDIRQGPSGLYVPGLTWVDVSSMDDVDRFIRHGSQNRTTSAHNINERSSRSHLVVTVEVAGDFVVDDGTSSGKRVVGKLNLIDLAGSERLSKTAAKGHQLEEAKNINKSLSALGNVIDALGKKKKGHVPFRNSKLTYLLQDSLNGSAKVLMFVNLSPVAWNASETLCSLKFAARCRATALGEAKKHSDSAEVAACRREIEAMRERLAEAERSAGGAKSTRFGFKR